MPNTPNNPLLGFLRGYFIGLFSNRGMSSSTSGSTTPRTGRLPSSKVSTSTPGRLCQYFHDDWDHLLTRFPFSKFNGDGDGRGIARRVWDQELLEGDTDQSAAFLLFFHLAIIYIAILIDIGVFFYFFTITSAISIAVLIKESLSISALVFRNFIITCFALSFSIVDANAIHNTMTTINTMPMSM